MTSIGRRLVPSAAGVALALAASGLAWVTPASAAASDLIVTGRVSVSATGGAGGSPAITDQSEISSDGRFVAFNSTVALVASDTNGEADVYLRDRLGGTTSRVSLTDADGQISGMSTLCGLSRDGRYVGFVGQGAGLPEPSVDQLYLRDRKLATTTLISRSTGGDPSDQGNGTSGLSTSEPCPISDDGRYVAFTSEAPNLSGGDGNGTGGDIFRRDRSTESTELVSVSSGGFGGNASSEQPAMSGNGSIVAFGSAATNLVASDSNALPDVFVRLLSTSQTQRVSVTSGGVQVTGGSESPALSRDGDRVAFTSTATTLVAGDTNATYDVFVRTRSTGAVARASVASGGGQLTANSVSCDISDDGTVVSFDAYFPDDLPGDTNQDDDVYVHRFADGTTTTASVTKAGTTGNDQSLAAALSGDGTTVAFTSDATDLVRNDTNGTTDTFVRDIAVDIAPFTSLKAFVQQQYQDFAGRLPSAAELTEWSARITNGERDPDELTDDLAHADAWAAKRAPLTRLYWAFFLRAPDSSGMTYWTNQLAGGKKLAAVAKQFSASSEFQSKYGALSNQAFVTKIYQNIFSRDPDAGGLAYWTKKLDTKQKTRGDVMVNFSESSEGKRVLAPQTDTVLIYLGMIRSMPSAAVMLEGIQTIRDLGYPSEIVSKSLRGLAGYAARVDVDGV